MSQPPAAAALPRRAAELLLQRPGRGLKGEDVGRLGTESSGGLWGGRALPGEAQENPRISP